MEMIITSTTICHYHHHNHHHMSLPSPQPPPSATIIITTTTICDYHHHNHHHLSLSSSQPPPTVTIITTTTTICHYYQHRHHTIFWRWDVRRKGKLFYCLSVSYLNNNLPISSPKLKFPGDRRDSIPKRLVGWFWWCQRHQNCLRFEKYDEQPTFRSLEDCQTKESEEHQDLSGLDVRRR